MNCALQNDIKGSLLVVDDDPEIRRTLEEILVRGGYRVNCVADGRICLTVAQDDPPDLILLDIHLSDTDGVEVCRLLKANEGTAGIPVILISGLREVEEKVRGFAAGCVDYVTKPFGSEEILARVATHLTISGSRRQIEAQNARLEQEILRSREAEESAKQWAAEWEETFNSMTDLVSLQDVDFTIVRVNKAFADAMGKDARDLIGKKCFEVVHGAGEPWPLCPQRQAILGGQPATEEFFELRQRKYFQVTVSRRCNDKGKMIGTIHVAKDITARREAEEAARRSEEKHRFIAENVDDVIWQIDPGYCFVYVSPSVSRLGGFEPEELTGKRATLFLSEHSRSLIEDLVDGRRSGAGPGLFRSMLELEFVAKDGATIPIEVKFTCHADRSGEPVSYQGVARDIRERKRAEQERLRLISAIERAAEAFCVVSAGGVIEYVNEAFCTLSGYKKEELVGNRIGFLANEKAERSVYKEIWDTVKAGYTWSGRLTQRTKDGSLFQIEGSIVPIREEGAITSYAAVARDITESLLLQEELQQSQKMEAMGALAGGIAHDFNNILAAIMGNAELALEDVPADSQTHGNLEGVLKAGMRGRDLVKQILAFTRKTKSEKRRVPLGPLVKETHDLLRASIPATIEMSLFMDFSSDTVEADPVQVQQVFLNLATNAADAMGEDGGRMETHLSSVSFAGSDTLPDKSMIPGAYVVLSVKDTGCGMTEQVRKRVFEPFFSTKKPGRGTGMGLAVVYGIVKDTNGFITVSSEPGAGSIFTVYFPAAKPSPKAKGEGKRLIQRGKREHLLFVDDEEPIVQVAVRILERLGYEVTAAQSSPEALEIFIRDSHAFDVVITDQTMPGMTGIALVEELKKVRSDIPVILCSGRADLMPSHQTRKLGIAAYVTKPFSSEELAKALQSVLGDRESSKESGSGKEKDGVTH